ncbi:MAG: hypothetical protein ABI729_08580, partial [Chitinophagales bacterium]
EVGDVLSSFEKAHDGKGDFFLFRWVCHNFFSALFPGARAAVKGSDTIDNFNNRNLSCPLLSHGASQPLPK